MKIFENGNWSDDEECPAYKTSKEGEIVLVPIVGTEEGKNMQAIQVHLKCLGNILMYYPEENIIAANCNIPKSE